MSSISKALAVGKYPIIIRPHAPKQPNPTNHGGLLTPPPFRLQTNTPFFSLSLLSWQCTIFMTLFHFNLRRYGGRRSTIAKIVSCCCFLGVHCALLFLLLYQKITDQSNASSESSDAAFKRSTVPAIFAVSSIYCCCWMLSPPGSITWVVFIWFAMYAPPTINSTNNELNLFLLFLLLLAAKSSPVSLPPLLFWPSTCQRTNNCVSCYYYLFALPFLIRPHSDIKLFPH